LLHRFNSREVNAMSVSVEDKMIAMSARRAVAKSSLDINQLNIACSKGVIELTGLVKAPRGFAGEYSVRKEFQALKATLQAVRGVRDVFGDRVRILD